MVLLVHQVENATHKIARIGDELSVVLGHKVLPGKVRIQRLGARSEQIVPPNVRRQVLLHGIGTENAQIATLAKLQKKKAVSVFRFHADARLTLPPS